MAKLWDFYGQGSFRNKVSNNTGIAKAVLDACGIPQGSHKSDGGALSGVDIKRMDALAAIKASLFEELKNGSLYELTTNNTGDAVIITVGEAGSLSDVYYTMQTYSYFNKAVAVMVTGRTPLPERKIGGYTELLSSMFNVMYWEADVIQSACAMRDFKRFATITYNDPHLSSSYEDGIDNLYDVTDPYESVLGYIFDVDYGNSDPYVEITFSQKSTVPIKLSGIGTLATVPMAAGDYTNESPDCLRGIGVTTECGEGAVTIEVPDSLIMDDRVTSSTSKLIGISGIYVVGYKVSVGYKPKTESDSISAPSVENTGVWIAPEDTTLDIIKLTDGTNYGIGYDGNTICVVFADRSPLDMQGLCGEGVEVNIPAWSSFADTYTQTVDLLPISETEAIVVKEVWAAVDVNSPSINIFDPNGAAMDIAKGISVRIAPITITQEPAPVALNGNLIRQDDNIVDHDPTTTQNLSSSAMEDALDSMNGKVGMSVTLSSLSSSEAVSLSNTLYDMYSNDNGVGTTYICGPGCGYVPVGSSVGGGIVNSVEYRYNDKSSYTVAVNTGPMFNSNFVASVDSGTYIKKTEDVTLEGVIVADMGDGVHYQVRIEGLGRREAMNSTMDIIRVGDIVSVKVSNNPVES